MGRWPAGQGDNERLASAQLLDGADTGPRPGPVLVSQDLSFLTERGVPPLSRSVGRNSAIPSSAETVSDAKQLDTISLGI